MIYKFRNSSYLIISDGKFVYYENKELQFPNEPMLKTNHRGDNIFAFDKNIPIKIEHSTPETMTTILENILNQEINV